jgi:1,4-dihydroxy-2-naphthoyl-CoA hydrolase
MDLTDHPAAAPDHVPPTIEGVPPMDLTMTPNGLTPELLNAMNAGNVHEWLGFEVTHVEPGRVVATLVVRPDHLNPMAGLHGGVTASFADSLCGYGTVSTQADPVRARFATLGLDANYLGPATTGDVLVGTATMIHGSRRLQTWDVTISCDDRAIAVVRVTQMVLSRDRNDRSDGNGQRPA